MGKFGKVTVVDKFNKIPKDREEGEKDFDFVCNGGSDEGCNSNYKSKSESTFRKHLYSFHKSQVAVVKDVPFIQRYNKSEENRDEEEQGYIYVCIAENGNCHTKYMSDS